KSHALQVGQHLIEQIEPAGQRGAEPEANFDIVLLRRCRVRHLPVNGRRDEEKGGEGQPPGAADEKRRRHDNDPEGIKCSADPTISAAARRRAKWRTWKYAPNVPSGPSERMVRSKKPGRLGKALADLPD